MEVDVYFPSFLKSSRGPTCLFGCELHLLTKYQSHSKDLGTDPIFENPAFIFSSSLWGSLQSTHPLGCAADGRVAVLCALQVSLHALFLLRLQVVWTLADQSVAFGFKVIQAVFKACYFFHHRLQQRT